MTDGIVPPEAARIEDSDDDQHENIWVPGSHVGLGFNAAVMWILADRLAQAEGEWRPFDPRRPGRHALSQDCEIPGPPEQGLSEGVAVPGWTRGQGTAALGG